MAARVTAGVLHERSGVVVMPVNIGAAAVGVACRLGACIVNFYTLRLRLVLEC